MGKMSQSLLKDLSVVVFTKERDAYLKRQVAYWQSAPVQLIILDGSSKPNNEIYKVFKSGRRLRYLHIPGWRNRFLAASDTIKTEFTVTVADDSFLLKSSILKCLSHLNQHPDVGTCAGQSLNFLTEHTFSSRPSLRVSRWAAGGTHLKYSQLADDPALRVREKAENYSCTAWYGVNRSYVSTSAWQILSQMGEPEVAPYSLHLYMYELTFELVSSYLARTTTLPCLYWLNSLENDALWSDSSRTPFSAWADSTEGMRALTNWSRIVSLHLSKGSPPNSLLDELFVTAVQSYSFCCAEYSQAHSASPCSGFLKLPAMSPVYLLGRLILLRRFNDNWLDVTRIIKDPRCLSVPQSVIDSTRWMDLVDIGLAISRTTR